MIGMSQIKRKFYTGLGVGLGVGLVLVTGVSIWSAVTINSYQEGTNKNYKEKYVKQVNVLTTDLIQGETITSDMYKTVDVHAKMVPSELTIVDEKGNIQASLYQPDGLVAKYPIAAGTAITPNMFTQEIVSQDLRETEINTVLMPTNLGVGQFVDIRIQFPNGTDYIVLVKKQIKQILNQTLWLDLTEEERSLLESANVDAYLNEGTKLYAIEYVDDTQIVMEQEEANELVKGKMISLIENELPELYTGSFDKQSLGAVDTKIKNIKKEIGIEVSEEDEENEENEESIEDETILEENFLEDVENDEEDVEIDTVENRRKVLNEILLALNLTENEYNEIQKITEEKATPEEQNNYLVEAIGNRILEDLDDMNVEELIEVLRKQLLNYESVEKADQIFDFIVTYRNLVACTTGTIQTYQPTDIVFSAMNLNPNIADEAKDKLSIYVRWNIDRLNKSTETYYGEDGVDKLITGAQASIEAQKSQRDSVMAVE